MDRRNSARDWTHVTPTPAKALAKIKRMPKPAPARASSEHAWAHANRAWMIACRLAASRR